MGRMYTARYSTQALNRAAMTTDTVTAELVRDLPSSNYQWSGRRAVTCHRQPEWRVFYFIASRSPLQACSQRRQASPQTRQCSCIAA